MAENSNQNKFRIGENGLTLEDVENRIIQLWIEPDLMQNSDKQSEFRTLKKARMEYLDASIRNEFGGFSKEYQRLAYDFDIKDEIRSHLQDKATEIAKWPPECRPEKIFAKVWYSFPEVQQGDDRQQLLNNALLEDASVKLMESTRPYYASYAKCGEIIVGTQLNATGGYPTRFRSLKNTHQLADLDIVRLVLKKEEITY